MRAGVTGHELMPELVRQARKEEAEYLRKMNVYTKAPIEECKSVTGKGPIGVRWGNVNKEDEINLKYRSRLVAKEINAHTMLDIYAATAPLEALRAVIGCTVNEDLAEKSGGPIKIMATDVSRAYFHVRVTRQVYVKLSPDDLRTWGRENVRSPIL